MKRVACILLDGISTFEFGIMCEIFGFDRTGDGLPAYEFSLCTPGARPVRAEEGYLISDTKDLSAVETADLVSVPALAEDSDVPQEVLDAIRRAADRGAYILSLCTGAFVLGQAGLLDGRRCTTHWRQASRLAQRFPEAKVDPDVLYVIDDNIITSAGTAAGIDACLFLIREVHGSSIATALARRLVMPPHRAGGQAQYIEAPVPPTHTAPTLEPLLAKLVTTLDQQTTVEDLAAAVHMAPRTFARRFRAETGTTPHDWITNQRVLLARRLLEETGLGVEAIAQRTGFGTAAMLRHHFVKRVGTTPQAYRDTFCDAVSRV